MTFQVLDHSLHMADKTQQDEESGRPNTAQTTAWSQTAQDAGDPIETVLALALSSIQAFTRVSSSRSNLCHAVKCAKLRCWSLLQQILIVYGKLPPVTECIAVATRSAYHNGRHEQAAWNGQASCHGHERQIDRSQQNQRAQCELTIIADAHLRLRAEGSKAEEVFDGLIWVCQEQRC